MNKFIIRNENVFMKIRNADKNENEWGKNKILFIFQKRML